MSDGDGRPLAPGEQFLVWPPERTWHLARVIIQPWLRPVTRTRIYGGDRVPRSGAAVVAANHIAAIDPFVLGAACPRSIRYMAKIELWSTPVVRHIIEHTGAFPVHRGQPDRAALAAARDVLRTGNLLGIFVEGTRQPTDEVGAARAGAAMLAVSEGAPILPVYLHGTDQFTRDPRRFPATVVYGTPMAVGGLGRGARVYRPVADAIEDELRRLREFTLSAIAVGRPRRATPPVSRPLAEVLVEQS
jgi:1-acyl-sn-glycerol-3-phosphate acyltransferase